MKRLVLLGILFSMSTVTWGAENDAAVQKEIECLALNVYHEARGEPPEGQLAVAYVTLNRVVSGRYPNSVCGVVFQPKQFSWTSDGRSDKPDNSDAWDRARSVAFYLYNNYDLFMRVSKGATDVTRGALHYYAPAKVNPDWARTMVATALIGGHVFLKDNS